MPERDRPQENGLPFRISLEAANRTVGLIALLLPLVLLATAAFGIGCDGLDSLSHYYYTPIGGDLFTGALFIIGAVMALFYHLPKDAAGDVIPVQGYRGHHLRDFRAARVAGLMAFVVALIPTSEPGCESYAGGIARAFLTDLTGERAAPGGVTGQQGFDLLAALGLPGSALAWLHYGAAAVMFAVLAWFSLVVFTRSQSGPVAAQSGVKRVRNTVYFICGALIVLPMLAIGYKELYLPRGSDARAAWNAANLTFWCETVALMAFGVSWSVKGRVSRRLRDPDDTSPVAKAARRVQP